MNQIAVGKFITKKRKEQNLTQEQLAEKLGVSNKTISKWECGKCMPDYSVVEPLCKELNTTLAELMNGEEDERSIHTYDNEQMIFMLQEIQRLRKNEIELKTCILFVLSGITLILSQLADTETLVGKFGTWSMLICGIAYILMGVRNHIHGINSMCEYKSKSSKNKATQLDETSDT